MPYTTGAQGTQGGPTGPTLQSGALWGPQGPVTGKASAFFTNAAGLAITSARLDLRYTTSQGRSWCISVSRTIAAESDLLNNFPDDVVQMANLIDFRPKIGHYYTTEGGAATQYRIMECTGMDDPIGQLLKHGGITDTFIANETGL